MHLSTHTDSLPPLLPATAGKGAGAPGALQQSRVGAFGLISDELGRVKELIDEQLAGAGGPVRRLLGQLNVCTGKMLRPGLVLLSHRAVRGGTPFCERKQNGNPDAYREGKNTQYEVRNTHDELIRIAAVVEMIHNATLLHDDVIDEGQRRRGLPTVNSLWGNESAVLLGDFLLGRVFRMCADLQPRFQRIIAATSNRVCEGELSQIIQRRNWQLSESEYIEIITEKSASLFSSCCLLGALSAGAGEGQGRSLAEFGRNLGIAFQITDDLLDITGDEGKTGKTPGSDVNKNKPTLAVIHLLRTVGKKERAAIISSLCVVRDAYREGKNTQYAIRNTQYDTTALVEELNFCGSLAYAHGRAREFVSKAVRALAGLSRSDAKDALIKMAEFAGRWVI